MLIVFISWAFFDAVSGAEAFATIGRMFGAGVSGIAGKDSLYYLRSYAIPFVIGIIGVTPLPKKLAERLAEKKVITVLEPVILAILFIAATACVVDGSFNPFIYFRF